MSRNPDGQLIPGAALLAAALSCAVPLPVFLLWGGLVAPQVAWVGGIDLSHGALAFAVSRRTKEIGIRLALGAARGRIIASIVREGLTVIVAGTVVGIALAVASSRVVGHLLSKPATPDWIVFATASLLVVVVGLVASMLPARRAAAVEPLVALHQE